MVVETSALVAIILLEPSADELGPKILAAGSATMASPSYLEAFMVLRKYLGSETEQVMNDRLGQLGVTVVAFTPEHAAEATRAFDRFGKGRHPAGLNFGDCIAYALAQVSGQTLLFVGDDFSKTDVRVA